MIGLLKRIYRFAKKKIVFFFSVNWIKTIYFNYKMLPYDQAKKLPFYFYGKVKFANLSGKVIIDSSIKTAMIGFGKKFETTTLAKGVAKLHIEGELVFKGYVHIGNDYLLYVGKDAYCEFGNMSGLGSDVKLICNHKIQLGQWTGVAYESQLMDSNSHPMMNTKTGEYYDMVGPIVLGDYNAISNRVSIMANTITANNCVIASNSLLNKDYSSFGEEVLLGGMPAKVLKTNFARDWEGEKENLKKWRGVKD
jgi:acetyltransferase-like isoleucine patch superfamily enzyme